MSGGEDLSVNGQGVTPERGNPQPQKSKRLCKEGSISDIIYKNIYEDKNKQNLYPNQIYFLILF